jgi:chromosome segregation ATPase
MSGDSLLLLIGSILGSSVITAFVTLMFTRRKISAETKETNARASSEEVDTTRKVTDFLNDVREENVDLYKRNTELEKENTDKTRTIEILSTRLESKDSQLAAATKQLDLLRSLAQQSPIIEVMQSQLVSLNEIIAKFQDASVEATKLMGEKDKILKDLSETNRNLELKRPSRS